jgi:hypothetical protein
MCEMHEVDHSEYAATAFFAPEGLSGGCYGGLRWFWRNDVMCQGDTMSLMTQRMVLLHVLRECLGDVGRCIRSYHWCTQVQVLQALRPGRLGALLQLFVIGWNIQHAESGYCATCWGVCMCCFLGVIAARTGRRCKEG